MLLLAAEQVPTGGFKIESIFFGLIAFMLVMSFFSARSQKKEKQKHLQWVDNLKKNEKVVTKGGIIGAVWSVKDDQVVIKIDEEKGTRMTVTKDAIAGSPREKKDEK